MISVRNPDFESFLTISVKNDVRMSDEKKCVCVCFLNLTFLNFKVSGFVTICQDSCFFLFLRNDPK